MMFYTSALSPILESSYRNPSGLAPGNGEISSEAEQQVIEAAARWDKK